MFVTLNQLNNRTDAVGFMIVGFDAVDPERRLGLATTRGRTRNARKWFVRRYKDNRWPDWDAGYVSFRAWTLDEAMERLNEPRIQNRIDKQFSDEQA